MSPRIIPVVLAGGSGTRLWPVSREAMPKQFLPLVGERSTYQQALARVSDPELFLPPIVVTGESFRFFAQRQAEELGVAPVVVLEPMRRDSGAAVAAAAAVARRRDPAAVVLTIAADHVMFDLELFHAACRAGREAALAGRIVTFGIKPSEPKTGYGYIRRGAPLGPPGVFAVDAFVEKPDAATAARYVAEGYLWNSGNFLFEARVLASELERFDPAMLEAVEAAVAGSTVDELGFVRLSAESFARAPQRSIDYAVMEKTDCAAVVEGAFRWSDIGSWDAVFDVMPRDADGNAVQGPVLAHEATNCLVHAEGRLTAVLGVSDLLVVSTPDAVLVAPRARAQDVRDLVKRLEAAGRAEVTTHRRTHRPWGYYDSVDIGDRFQVKRIAVYSGGRLSLQRHLHRSEHWVVVRGTAEVTLGEETRTVHENESVYIPIGRTHRLENPGKIPLELIEVQTGSYLGEDDIIRLDDVYRRS